MTTLRVDEKRMLVINPSTREIIVPKSERVFGTFDELGFEKKYFLCPKVIGNNIDISECFIFVNYISSGGNNGQILITDIEIDDENSSVKFVWSLTPNVFDENRDATIYFSVHAKLMVNGKLKTVFKTRIAQGKSYATIDSTDEVLLKNADVIVQILDRVGKLEGKLTPESFEKAFEDYFSENPNSLVKNIPTDDSLKVTADGKLGVNTTTEVSKDNTLPVTAGAVHLQIGNINALLETI